MKQVIPFFLLLILGYSCTSDEEEIPIEGIDFSFEVKRLDQAIGEIKTLEQAHAYINTEEAYKAYILSIFFPNDSIFAQKTLQKATNPGFQEFYEQGAPTRTRVSASLQSMEDVVKRIKYYYPDFTPPTLVTTYDGYGSPALQLQKEIYMVGLDQFSQDVLDVKYQLTGGEFPQYIMKFYTLDYLPTKFAQGLASKFNQFNKEDESLLAYMVYYGKELYFMEKVCPGLPDSVYMEYTPKEMEETQLMEAGLIWPKLQGYLFEANPQDRARLVQPAPNSPLIADSCPGRIGRYIGWQIVRSYMEKQENMTLRDLMETKDAKSIFMQSGYKPRPPEG